MHSKSAEAAAYTIDGGVDSAAQAMILGLVFCSIGRGESGEIGRKGSWLERSGMERGNIRKIFS